MHGNVWQWCQDWFGEYKAEPEVNPKGPAQGDYHVVCGGSWDFVIRSIRALGGSGRVMIPEIVRQSLRLDGLSAGPVDRKGGPVPESWQWRWN
jgi:formylglycine-generating enzyme required for sulfatase activity